MLGHGCRYPYGGAPVVIGQFYELHNNRYDDDEETMMTVFFIITIISVITIIIQRAQNGRFSHIRLGHACVRV